MDEKECPRGLSFIVCCYNSEARIAETLAALKAQENGEIPYEVLLVDNNCSDKTVSLAKSIWDRSDIPLRVVTEKRPGVGHARKTGVMSAGYAYISFVDDDNIVEKKWVRKVADFFAKRPDVAAVGSRNEALPEGPVPFWFEKNQHCYACGPQLTVSGPVTADRAYLWGAGLSLRRKIIREILESDWPLYLQGRKENSLTSGEDVEICMRMYLAGWKLWYDGDLRLQHRISRSRLCWKYFCRLQEGFGRTAPVLYLYRNLIRGTSPRSCPALVSLKLKQLFFLLLRYHVRLLFSREGETFQTQFCYERTYLKELLRLGRRYHRICRTIREKSASGAQRRLISPDC